VPPIKQIRGKMYKLQVAYALVRTPRADEPTCGGRTVRPLIGRAHVSGGNSPLHQIAELVTGAGEFAGLRAHYLVGQRQVQVADRARD